MHSDRILEVCVEDSDGLDAAIAGGADRIELCAALAVGGLTPPASLIRAAAAAPIPVHVLIRPREGGFVYSPRDCALIADDIRTASDAGLAGVVIGASAPDGRLDAAALTALLQHARALGTARGTPFSLTLHRAFDLCPDLGEALETGITLGFDRVLTSGGTPKAIDGLAAIAALHRQAAGRITILAGSGVSPETLPAILGTGVTEVHASCREAATTPADSQQVRFGFASPVRSMTSAARVRSLAGILVQTPA